MDPQLWAWVDRLIYDSQNWKDFDKQMRLVETAEQEAKQRIVLCDLNWTRLDKVRYALAQFFDHPASHHRFAKMESVHSGFRAGIQVDRHSVSWMAGGAVEMENESAANERKLPVC